MRRGRRIAPRRLGEALGAFVEGTVPDGELVGVRRVWSAAAGPVVAEHATPVALRDGVLVVACDEAVWAQQLALLGPDLVARIERLAPDAGVRELRTRAGR